MYYIQTQELLKRGQRSWVDLCHGLTFWIINIKGVLALLLSINFFFVNYVLVKFIFILVNKIFTLTKKEATFEPNLQVKIM